MRPDLRATSALRFSASVVRLAGCDPLQMLRTISSARRQLSSSVFRASMKFLSPSGLMDFSVGRVKADRVRSHFLFLKRSALLWRSR